MLHTDENDTPFLQFTPEMAKMAAETFSKMSPKEIEQMAEIASSMQRPAAFEGSSAAGRPSPTTTASTSLQAAGGGASYSGATLTAVQMQEAMACMGSRGAGMPPGMSPDMAKMVGAGMCCMPRAARCTDELKACFFS